MTSHSLNEARERMVDRDLRGRGIRDERVLAAMGRVPREQFISAEQLNSAYDDGALAIECGQTISQPYIVALMTEQLELSGVERVLELGTGSGYQTAVLAELSGEVWTVERHGMLSERAANRLNQLGYTGVHYRVGDGTAGWPTAAPFDRVMITACAPACPPAVWRQLREGGILVAPFGDREQSLYQLRKHSRGVESRTLIPCRFVPLIPSPGPVSPDAFFPPRSGPG